MLWLPFWSAIRSYVYATLVASGQIKFPAVQNPSSDPNTLDDYEEGTWTPALAGSTTAGTQTYAVTVGSYTKIGREVSSHWTLGLSAKDATTAGALQIRGFPFAALGPSMTYPAALAYTRFLTLDAGFSMIQVSIAAGNTYADIWEAGSGNVPQPLVAASFAATTFIYGTIVYTTT